MEELSFEMNVAAAKLARASADAVTAKTPDRPRIVAGAMGPTNRTASISPDVNNPGFRNVSYDELVEAYSEQARGLIEGGADVLLIETIFDTLNAKAAGFAALTVFDEMGVELPLIISGTITDRSGRTLSGQTPEAFYFSMRHLRPFALGLNCALGAELMRPYIAEIAAVAETRVIAYPNAGLPNAMGEYDEGPCEMAGQHRAVDAREAWSTSSAAAAARRPSTSPRSPPTPPRCPRASCPGSSARCASPASNPSCMGDAMTESGADRTCVHRALRLSPARGEDARPSDGHVRIAPSVRRPSWRVRESFVPSGDGRLLLRDFLCDEAMLIVERRSHHDSPGKDAVAPISGGLG